MDQLTYLKNVLSLILQPGEVHELRALDVPRGKDFSVHESGYFDAIQAMAEAALQLDNRLARGIYFTPNPVSPDLLARRVNRTAKSKRGESTTDANVTRRRWLLIDFDPIRTVGISSTDAEHDLALQRAQNVRAAMLLDGWPDPLQGDSGNGSHLMWRVDEPNDDETTDLFRKVIGHFGERFGDDQVEVDRTSFNAARIWKLYGTSSRKGDSTEERPHRPAHLINAPSTRPALLTREQLEAFVPAEMPKAATTRDSSDGFDIEAFVEAHFPDADGPRAYDGGLKWVLPVCPWNSAHDDRAAFILQLSSGAISAGCHHNGCVGRNWHDLRDQFDPQRELERRLTPNDSDIAELMGSQVNVEERPHWKASLIWNDAVGNKDPTLRPILANIITILGNDPRWAGVLAFNEFRSQIVTRREPPWDPDDRPADRWEPMQAWTDEDDIRVTAWLSRNWGLHYSRSPAPAVAVTAQQRTFHPVRDYLSGLKWDGTDRLSNWLTEYLGAEDTPYVRAVGRWWLVSAVARIFDPGCKADHVIIFEGLQGLGKSRTIRALSEPWYIDTSIDLGTKDSFLAIRGRWIVEMAELDSFSRAAATRAKAFFSSSVDAFRPPYGRGTIDVPRQCVFAGSTNDDGYLKDPTGGRRYWPVACHATAVEQLEEDRDQLWAEVVLAYRRGERWWPTTSAENDLCREEQDQRYQADAWEDIIADWSRGQICSFVMLDEVLSGALALEKGKMTRNEQMRAAACLKRLGFKRLQKQINGRRRWVYERPGFKQETEQDELPFFS